MIIAHFTEIGRGQTRRGLKFIDEVLTIGKTCVGTDLIQRHVGIEQQLFTFFDTQAVEFFDDGCPEMFFEKSLQVCLMNAYRRGDIVDRDGLHKVLIDEGQRFFEMNDSGLLSAVRKAGIELDEELQQARALLELIGEGPGADVLAER